MGLASWFRLKGNAEQYFWVLLWEIRPPTRRRMVTSVGAQESYSSSLLPHYQLIRRKPHTLQPSLQILPIKTSPPKPLGTLWFLEPQATHSPCWALQSTFAAPNWCCDLFGLIVHQAHDPAFPNGTWTDIPQNKVMGEWGTLWTSKASLGEGSPFLSGVKRTRRNLQIIHLFLKDRSRIPWVLPSIGLCARNHVNLVQGRVQPADESKSWIPASEPPARSFPPVEGRAASAP